jgi:hypothetical protein
MSFIKSSKDAYKLVEALEQHTQEHEVSMARSNAAAILDKSIMLKDMLTKDASKVEGLRPWVESKITTATNYVVMIHDYLKYYPTIKAKYTEVKEEVSKDEVDMVIASLNNMIHKSNEISKMMIYMRDHNTELEPWVSSKLQTAKDNVSAVCDYMHYSPDLAMESVEIKETSISDIHKMKKDGKSSEDIAKELKLNAGLVKKILGEEVELKEFTDAMLAALKKEYDPLKGKTITTSQYQQLKNILIKLQDGDLEKLQKQNIPFASTGAGSILRVRKSPVKITNIKVPGLEGMAEETTFWWHDGKTGYVKAGYDNKELLAWLKKNGYKPEKDIKEEEPKVKKQKDQTNNIPQNIEPTNASGANTQVGLSMGETVELKPVPSLEDSAKKHNVDIEALKKQLEKGIKSESEHTDDPKVAEKIALAHLDERPDYYDQLDKMEKLPVKDIEEHIVKVKGGYQLQSKSTGKNLGTYPTKDGAEKRERQVQYFKHNEETKEPTGKLADACWAGYTAVGFKMKNGKRVPNCVPKSEAYKGAKSIVEKAWKKLKEKK